MIFFNTIRWSILLGLLLVAVTTKAQPYRALLNQPPRELTHSQWKSFKGAWAKEKPWVSVELRTGEVLQGQLLHHATGEGFHFWNTTDFFDPLLWKDHYRYLSYDEVFRISELFVYPSGNFVGALLGGTFIVGSLGLPFSVVHITAGIGALAGIGVFLTKRFVLSDSSPRLLFLKRKSSGNSYYRDSQLLNRQIFREGLPDSTSIPYQRIDEWVPSSRMMSRIFFEPKSRAHMGVGVVFIPIQGLERGPYLEVVAGFTASLPKTPIFWGIGISNISVALGSASSGPAFSFLDLEANISYPIMKMNRFGGQPWQISPELGLLVRSLKYSFLANSQTFVQRNNILGGVLGLKAEYRLGHRLMAWAKGQAKIVPNVQFPWPTEAFDPNILTETSISTNSYHAQLGFAWLF